MNLTNYIKIYDGALPDGLCDAIVQKFELDNRKIEGSVLNEQGPILKDVRSCLELNITQQPDWDQFNSLLIRQTQGVIAQYQKDIKGYIWPDQYGFEQFRMKKYSCSPERNDRFEQHVDVINYPSARRFLVCFYYLNDVEEGGETTFPSLGLKVKPKKGRVLLFPPMWMYPHAGERPVSNDKFICGSYLHLI